jgi:hypothetical protein
MILTGDTQHIPYTNDISLQIAKQAQCINIH